MTKPISWLPTKQIQMPSNLEKDSIPGKVRWYLCIGVCMRCVCMRVLCVCVCVCVCVLLFVTNASARDTSAYRPYEN